MHYCATLEFDNMFIYLHLFVCNQGVLINMDETNLNDGNSAVQNSDSSEEMIPRVKRQQSCFPPRCNQAGINNNNYPGCTNITFSQCEMGSYCHVFLIDDSWKLAELISITE